jgi:hypothetical protein
MTTSKRNSTKLNDTQLMLLSAASQRRDYLMIRPETVSPRAFTRAANALLKNGLIAKRSVAGRISCQRQGTGGRPHSASPTPVLRRSASQEDRTRPRRPAREGDAESASEESVRAPCCRSVTSVKRPLSRIGRTKRPSQSRYCRARRASLRRWLGHRVAAAYHASRPHPSASKRLRSSGRMEQTGRSSTTS